MACTSAGDSKELSGLVALKATSSASRLFLANLLHGFKFVRDGGIWRRSGLGHGYLSVDSSDS